MPEALRLTIDGDEFRVTPGTTVAAAIANHRGLAMHRSVLGQPRGPLCGMGICHECRVRIDGRPDQRACMIPCAEGMEVHTDA